MNNKTKQTYVIGHKNPDTDSICSAIAYAHLKKEITGERYSARRAGQINEETQYVLKRFQMRAPKLLPDVKLQLQDAEINKIEGCGPNVSIKRAWELLKKQKMKTLPILENDELLGQQEISQALIWIFMIIRSWQGLRHSIVILLILWMGH